MQEEYLSSQSDLENLLKIDPKNAPAKRELQVVKNYIVEVCIQILWHFCMKWAYIYLKIDSFPRH